MILGVGVDIIEIGRIKQAIERWGDAFLKTIYTPDELKYAKKYKFPYAHYAGRFAAKEALYKALGDKKVRWLDLNIQNDKSGKPYCIFTKNNFLHKIHLTISHSKDYAVAHAIIEAQST